MRRQETHSEHVVSVIDSEGNLRSIGDIERQVILHALAYCNGNMTLVAQNLRIGRSTLYRKMSTYTAEREQGVDPLVLRAVDGSKKNSSSQGEQTIAQ